MLKAKGISYRYAPHLPWILKGVDLEIKAGERIGLWGSSGRGKTTLAKILAGYLNPMTGEVDLDGKPLPSQAFAPVQLVFQNPELAINPRWRIRQVLSETLPKSHPLNLEALAQHGVDPAWLDRWPHELSGGELQRIALARALGSQTRYLICDEITAMLDALTQAVIWESLLKQAQNQGIGLLVISHEQNLLSQVCDRLIEL
ncbi:MAG: ATP-binding cassette domain-containing protein [Synechococcaceae cyanobacterium SM2_3_2]|nr:ATP-binding cassette domain-containing protein [Synechococcaceae cyanobacterium SM2_3_2]